MKFLILFLSLFLISQTALARKGIEECRNIEHRIYSVTDKQLGPVFKVTYKGKTYESSFADIIANEGNIGFENEKVTYFKCDGDKLVERNSLRDIFLLDKTGKVVIRAQLNCKGYYPNGVEILPPHLYLCPKR